MKLSLIKILQYTAIVVLSALLLCAILARPYTIFNIRKNKILKPAIIDTFYMSAKNYLDFEYHYFYNTQKYTGRFVFPFKGKFIASENTVFTYDENKKFTIGDTVFIYLNSKSPRMSMPCNEIDKY